MKNQFVIPEWIVFSDHIDELFEIVQDNKNGKVLCFLIYRKTCVKWPLSKRLNICFKGMGEHSAILATFIKLPIFIKISVLSIFKWPSYTYFTV